VAGFLGTYLGATLVRRNLNALLVGLPLALSAVSLAMLAVGHSLWGVALLMICWGTINSAIPVTWSTWLTKAMRDEPEAGGGLMVAAIQLAIMLGAAFGGVLLDHVSISATFFGGTALLVLGSLTIAYTQRTKRDAVTLEPTLASAEPVPAE
jgi:predicted MFS family arabinose efflux permease